MHTSSSECYTPVVNSLSALQSSLFISEQKTGILVISVLLGTFLASFLGLIIYSAVSPRWTAQLDAFAMLRIGASIADKVRSRATSKAQCVGV